MWIERLARVGYAGIGTVYAIIGFLAAGAAMGIGGKAAADHKAAIHFIIGKPFGRLVLVILALGLLGYGLWRILIGIRDTERKGNDAKAMAVRIGSFIRGVGYSWIAFELVRVVFRQRSVGAGGDAEAEHWASRAMSAPWGRYIMAIAAAIAVGYALYQLYHATAQRLRNEPHIPAGALRNVARFGVAARSVVIVIVASSYFIAALRHDPGQAHGTSGALLEVLSQPHGRILLTIVGLGLVAYGTYGFINARYRRISTT